MNFRSLFTPHAFSWLPFLVGLSVCHLACAHAGEKPTTLTLENADFENGLVSWTPREKVAMTRIVPDAAHTGKMGLRVLDEDATAGSHVLSAPVAITGGQSYRLHFWVRTVSNQAAVVQFRYYDTSRKSLESATGKLPIASTGGKWKEVSFADHTPENAATLAVWIHSYSGAKATLDFDDFSLEAALDDEVPAGELPAAVSVTAGEPRPTNSTAFAPSSKVVVARQAPPYIIIKADDLRSVNGHVHARWKKFADFIKARKVHASIGIICNSLEGDNPQYINWIKEQQATGLFEFWNHGYVHEPTKVNGQTVQEFKGPSYEEQKQHYMRAQQLGREKLGAAFATFGAPSNAADENTAKMLSEDSDTKIWLYGDDKHSAGKLILDRVYPVNIENPLFVPSLDKFVEGYNRYPQREYFVIQGHAAKWDDARFEQFTQIVDFLIAQKAIFVTPSEYAKIKGAQSAPTQTTPTTGNR